MLKQVIIVIFVLVILILGAMVAFNFLSDDEPALATAGGQVDIKAETPKETAEKQKPAPAVEEFDPFAETPAEDLTAAAPESVTEKTAEEPAPAEEELPDIFADKTDAAPAEEATEETVEEDAAPAEEATEEAVEEDAAPAEEATEEEVSEAAPAEVEEATEAAPAEEAVEEDAAPAEEDAAPATPAEAEEDTEEVTPADEAPADEAAAEEDKAAKETPETSEEAPATEEVAVVEEPEPAPQAVAKESSPLTERVMGKANAPVTIIEYASITCPHCANFHTGSLPDIKKKYVDTGKVKVIYRDLPTSGLATQAAMLTRCAPENVYFDYLGAVFKTQGEWLVSQTPLPQIKTLGKQLGLTDEAAEECLTNQELLKVITARVQEASSKYKLSSTPSFIIMKTGGTAFETLSGVKTIEEFSPIVDKFLAQ